MKSKCWAKNIQYLDRAKAVRYLTMNHTIVALITNDIVAGVH